MDKPWWWARPRTRGRKTRMTTNYLRYTETSLRRWTEIRILYNFYSGPSLTGFVFFFFTTITIVRRLPNLVPHNTNVARVPNRPRISRRQNITGRYVLLLSKSRSFVAGAHIARRSFDGPQTVNETTIDYTEHGGPPSMSTTTWCWHARADVSHAYRNAAKWERVKDVQTRQRRKSAPATNRTLDVRPRNRFSSNHF